jgi:AcrR family transcriptional regulator
VRILRLFQYQDGTSGQGQFTGKKESDRASPGNDDIVRRLIWVVIHECLVPDRGRALRFRRCLWNAIPLYWNGVPFVSSWVMAKKVRKGHRREESLTRDRIIEASIELLDSSGESGLTFRALSERLATGPGAIYWHIANKSDLLAAACDAVVARTMNETVVTTPEATIRAVALGLFDVIDEHPWVGSALTSSPGLSPIVRILERVGQQIRAFGVPDEQQWASVGALMAYILGVSGQNAANGQLARTRGLDRSEFLEAVSTAWSQLDPQEYPFARSIARQIRDHDDRVDFLAGIDLILSGIKSSRGC